MSMEIAVTGLQANVAGANIIYNGNGATSGCMLSTPITADKNINLDSNTYKKVYTVNLDANGGEVSTNKVVSEYKFSHWSDENVSDNVIYHSDKEVNSRNGIWQIDNEFIQYVDLAPYIDKYGTGNYFLSFDIKSEDITNYNVMAVYFQNGIFSRYGFAGTNGGKYICDVTTEYQHKVLNSKIQMSRPSETKAMLAFYGVYETGNKPVVKNVTFDKGNGYEDEEEISTNILNNENVEDIRLYAKWIQQEVTLPTPSKEGYKFKGWYTSAEGGEKVSDTLIPSSDVTYYAQWEEDI